MKIEKIIFENFKSFGTPPVSVDVSKTFNAVVGMNGSGKSNLLDAILFLLDAPKKMLRVTKIEDLIHLRDPNLKVSVEIIFSDASEKISFKKNFYKKKSDFFVDEQQKNYEKFYKTFGEKICDRNLVISICAIQGCSGSADQIIDSWESLIDVIASTSHLKAENSEISDRIERIEKEKAEMIEEQSKNLSKMEFLEKFYKINQQSFENITSQGAKIFNSSKKIIEKNSKNLKKIEENISENLKLVAAQKLKIEEVSFKDDQQLSKLQLRLQEITENNQKVDENIENLTNVIVEKKQLIASKRDTLRDLNFHTVSDLAEYESKLEILKSELSNENIDALCNAKLTVEIEKARESLVNFDGKTKKLNSEIFSLKNEIENFSEEKSFLETKIIHLNKKIHYNEKLATSSVQFFYDFFSLKKHFDIEFLIENCFVSTEFLVPVSSAAFNILKNVAIVKDDSQIFEILQKAKNLKISTIRIFSLKNLPKIEPSNEQLCPRLDSLIESKYPQIVSFLLNSWHLVPDFQTAKVWADNSNCVTSCGKIIKKTGEVYFSVKSDFFLTKEAKKIDKNQIFSELSNDREEVRAHQSRLLEVKNVTSEKTKIYGKKNFELKKMQQKFESTKKIAEMEIYDSEKVDLVSKKILEVKTIENLLENEYRKIAENEQNIQTKNALLNDIELLEQSITLLDKRLAEIKLQPKLKFSDEETLRELLIRKDTCQKSVESLINEIETFNQRNEQDAAKAESLKRQNSELSKIIETLVAFSLESTEQITYKEIIKSYGPLQVSIQEYKETKNLSDEFLQISEKNLNFSEKILKFDQKISQLKIKFSENDLNRIKAIEHHSKDICKILDGFSRYFPISKIHLNILTVDFKIQFMIRPDETGYKTILQLSGGQKALAFTLFKLSIMEKLGVPFIFLDEVDANLDRVAIQELAKLIVDKQYQIIAISVRNDLFNFADRIIGVWKDKFGESHLVLS